MGRAPCCEKVGLKRGRWTAKEDEILTQYIKANGEGSWRSLPKNAGLLRCGKSCRLRWINYLRDDLKRGNICHEEETLIVKLHASFGNSQLLDLQYTILLQFISILMYLRKCVFYFYIVPNGFNIANIFSNLNFSLYI
ncbi:hypothetical protein RYX36_032004 [Vicia faba]